MGTSLERMKIIIEEKNTVLRKKFNWRMKKGTLLRNIIICHKT